MEKEKLTQLVKAVQNGSEAAVTELYNGYHNDLYYYILKTLDSRNDPDLAADLTQDAFIEILQTIDKLQDPEAFLTWSRKIAYHRCTAYFRKRHELLVDEQEDGSTIFDTMVEEREEFIPGEALDKEALRNAIREMIDSLPEEQRSAIMMRYFDELSVQQIANIQSTTEGTVKSRLNYGRKAIKKAVEDYEKKHDIKLRCAGIVPLLLWLFRAQKQANAAAKLASIGVSSQPAAGKAAMSGAGKKAAVVAKNVAKLTTRKVIAAVVAAAVSVGVIGAGVSQLAKNKTHQPSDPSGSQSISHNNAADSGAETTVIPEDYFGNWTNGGDMLNISYSAVTERYYFEYAPSGDIPFAFFADFDAEAGAFCVPEGHACGYTQTDSDGNSSMTWQETDNPALRFVCRDDLIYWYIGENEPQTLFRADVRDAENNPQSSNEESMDAVTVQYKLEDYSLYVQKVGEYASAVFGSYSEEMYPTLNTHMLNYYHNFGEGASFCYALKDIDGNGTPELLIGKGYSVGSKPEIIDIYSICGNAIVQYFESPYFGERVSLSVLAGGQLMEAGSSSAASGGCTIYQISEDGGSIYSVAGYGYFFPDENTPPPEGDYMSYDAYQTAIAQYEYDSEFNWISLSA